MVTAILIGISTILISAVAELLHQRRIGRISGLVFGRDPRPTLISRILPIVKPVSIGAVFWGLTILIYLSPLAHTTKSLPKEHRQNLLIVLDVSPSMRLMDGGRNRTQTRMQRAAEVMHSLFDLTNPDAYSLSIVATYTKAIPVCEQSTDMELIHHVLGDLPMHFGFHPGKTDLACGINYGFDMAQNWKTASTTMFVITDGDSTSMTDFEHRPSSISDISVFGVGDTNRDLPIDGETSRQDRVALGSLSQRLNATYFDVNELLPPSSFINGLTIVTGDLLRVEAFWRRIAMFAITTGSLIWMLCPIILHYFGSHWYPGVRNHRQSDRHKHLEMVT